MQCFRMFSFDIVPKYFLGQLSSLKGVALAMVKHKNVRNPHNMSAMSALYKIEQVVHFSENY